MPDPVERQAALEFMSSAPPEWRDFQVHVRDGRVFDTSWTNVRLSDGALIGIGQEVTARQRLEAQLRQAQKMDVIGHLAAGVAHSFNNLLTVVSGNAQIMQEWLPPRHRLRPHATEIVKAAQRGASLARRLLTHGRRREPQAEVLDPNAVIADLKPLLRPLIEEDIELVLAPDPAVGEIQADPGQIQEIILTLAANARDAMPQGGRLTMETANAGLEGEPGAFVMLAVTEIGRAHV